jgi:hypothetical protein
LIWLHHARHERLCPIQSSNSKVTGVVIAMRKGEKFMLCWGGESVRRFDWTQTDEQSEREGPSKKWTR